MTLNPHKLTKSVCGKLTLPFSRQPAAIRSTTATFPFAKMDFRNSHHVMETVGQRRKRGYMCESPPDG